MGVCWFVGAILIVVSVSLALLLKWKAKWFIFSISMASSSCLFINPLPCLICILCRKHLRGFNHLYRASFEPGRQLYRHCLDLSSQRFFFFWENEPLLMGWAICHNSTRSSWSGTTHWADNLYEAYIISIKFQCRTDLNFLTPLHHLFFLFKFTNH